MVGCLVPFVLLIVGGLAGAAIGGHAGAYYGGAVGLITGMAIMIVLIVILSLSKQR